MARTQPYTQTHQAMQRLKAKAHAHAHAYNNRDTNKMQLKKGSIKVSYLLFMILKNT